MTGISLKAFLPNDILDKTLGEEAATLEAGFRTSRTSIASPSIDVLKPMLTAAPPASGFDHIPSYIYFSKIGFSNDGSLKVDQQLYYEVGDFADTPNARKKIKHSDVADKIEKLMSNPTELPSNVRVEQFGENFKNSGKHWDRVSYLAFLIDHPKWSFCELNPTNDNFPKLPPAVFHRLTKNGNHKKNKTFFDGQVETIEVNGESRSLFFCVNHLRDQYKKRPLKIHHEQFKFDLYTQFNFGDEFKPAILIFDPGGDNQGPPMPPPNLV